MHKNGQKWPFTDHGRLANFTLFEKYSDDDRDRDIFEEVFNDGDDIFESIFDDNRDIFQGVYDDGHEKFEKVLDDVKDILEKVSDDEGWLKGLFKGV